MANLITTQSGQIDVERILYVIGTTVYYDNGSILRNIDTAPLMSSLVNLDGVYINARQVSVYSTTQIIFRNGENICVKTTADLAQAISSSDTATSNGVSAIISSAEIKNDDSLIICGQTFKIEDDGDPTVLIVDSTHYCPNNMQNWTESHPIPSTIKVYVDGGTDIRTFTRMEVGDIISIITYDATFQLIGYINCNPSIPFSDTFTVGANSQYTLTCTANSGVPLFILTNDNPSDEPGEEPGDEPGDEPSDTTATYCSLTAESGCENTGYLDDRSSFRMLNSTDILLGVTDNGDEDVAFPTIVYYEREENDETVASGTYRLSEDYIDEPYGDTGGTWASMTYYRYDPDDESYNMGDAINLVVGCTSYAGDYDVWNYGEE